MWQSSISGAQTQCHPLPPLRTLPAADTTPGTRRPTAPPSGWWLRAVRRRWSRRWRLWAPCPWRWMPAASTSTSTSQVQSRFVVWMGKLRQAASRAPAFPQGNRIHHLAFIWTGSGGGQPRAHSGSALPRHLQQHVLRPAGEPRDAGRGLRHEPGERAQRQLLDLKEQVGAEGIPKAAAPFGGAHTRPVAPLRLGLEPHGRSVPVPQGALAPVSLAAGSWRAGSGRAPSPSLPAAGRRCGASRATSAC